MCSKMDMDHDSFKVLAELIDEEIDLYEPEDIPVLMMASHDNIYQVFDENKFEKHSLML
jgi:hypothetical protein